MDKSFEILLNEHRDMMLSYASTLMGNDTHAAEDVVQEASLIAYRKLETFDTSRNFAKWLRGIVRIKVLENKRYTRRRPLILDPDVVSGIDEVYGLFDRPKTCETWLDRVHLLRSCVEKLNHPMRVVVEYFYRSGLSLREIAERMRLNEMTVGQRLSRSRKLLRHCVETQLQKELR